MSTLTPASKAILKPFLRDFVEHEVNGAPILATNGLVTADRAKISLEITHAKLSMCMHHPAYKKLRKAKRAKHQKALYLLISTSLEAKATYIHELCTSDFVRSIDILERVQEVTDTTFTVRSPLMAVYDLVLHVKITPYFLQLTGTKRQA